MDLAEESYWNVRGRRTRIETWRRPEITKLAPWSFSDVRDGQMHISAIADPSLAAFDVTPEGIFFRRCARPSPDYSVRPDELWEICLCGSDVSGYVRRLTWSIKKRPGLAVLVGLVRCHEIALGPGQRMSGKPAFLGPLQNSAGFDFQVIGRLL